MVAKAPNTHMSNPANNTWPSAAVALGLLVLIGAIAVSAIRRYPTPEEALKVWAALSVLIGVVTGAFVAYFFTKDQVKQANEQLGQANQQVNQANEQVVQANQQVAQADQQVVQANEQMTQANQQAIQAKEMADLEAEKFARMKQAVAQRLDEVEPKVRTEFLKDQEMATLFS